MRKKQQKPEKKSRVIKILRQYALCTGYGKFKLLSVYDDGSVALGCEQKFDDKTLIELKI
jgi:hypothetical protein